VLTSIITAQPATPTLLRESALLIAVAMTGTGSVSWGETAGGPRNLAVRGDDDTDLAEYYELKFNKVGLEQRVLWAGLRAT